MTPILWAGLESVAPVLRLECAWCGTTIRDGKLPISHGCCKACSEKLLAQMDARP